MRFTTIVLACAPILLSSQVEAGVFTDDLSRCMVQKATDADKIQLARWMFAAMSKDPSLVDMAKISQQERDRLNKGTADLFGRLVLTECRPQAIAALKNEGGEAFGEAGRVLGQAAAQKLMSSPEGQAELGKLGDYVDEKAWAALAKEAGISAKAK